MGSQPFFFFEKQPFSKENKNKKKTRSEKADEDNTFVGYFYTIIHSLNKREERKRFRIGRIGVGDIERTSTREFKDKLLESVKQVCDS